MARPSCSYRVAKDSGNTHGMYNGIHTLLRMTAVRWDNICEERRAASTAASTTCEQVPMAHDTTNWPGTAHLAVTGRGAQADYEVAPVLPDTVLPDSVHSAEEAMFSVENSDDLRVMWPYDDNFDASGGLHTFQSKENSAKSSRLGSQSPTHHMLQQYDRSEDDDSDDDQNFKKTWRDMFLSPAPEEETVEVPKTPEETNTEVAMTPSTMPRSSTHNNRQRVRTNNMENHYPNNNSQFLRIESSLCAARGGNSRLHPYTQSPPPVRRNHRHGGFV